MCRMIAVVSKNNIDMEYFVNKLAYQAENGMHAPHYHGYGIGYFCDKIYIEKEINPITERTINFSDIETKTAIFHARKASVGHIVEENVHPFSLKYNNEDFCFCHNGTIKDIINLDFETDKIKSGTTDTKIYFDLIISELETSPDTETAVKKAINKITDKCTDITSLNSFILNKNNIIVSRFCYLEEDYYTLFIAELPEMTIVSTEKFDNYSWELIKNHSTISLKK